MASTTITVAGGNLFAIAAQQYGDAGQWVILAQANGLTDPFISGQMTLNVPQSPASALGGIPAQ